MSGKWRRAMWNATGQALTAHGVMLLDTSILDEGSAAAVLGTVDAVRLGEPPDVEGVLALIAAFDERFDSQSSVNISGAGRIGRARHDLAATTLRLALRERALDLAEAQTAARGALIDLAESHVFTLMPAWAGSVALQPTNFAHFLGSVIAPLGRAGRRLRAAIVDLDRMPMGAGALAGPALPIDREETAELLGSEGPTESTFDALSAIDHLEELMQASASGIVPLRRLISELLLWLRTEPQSLRLADELLAPLDAGLPHYRPPLALERIVADARAIEERAELVSRGVREIPLGSAIEFTDRAAEQTARALSQATRVSASVAALVSGPIEINRAWLARNAGRDLMTSGELADFLMAEEGLDPGSARDIAALTTHRALEGGLEASGITPALIDSAALLVIGRELGIEIERLGGFLAPRRFIEKRAMTGGPAAPAVREYLEIEKGRLRDDLQWIEETRRRIALAEENLSIRYHEIIAAASL